MSTVADRATICHVLHGLGVGGAEVLAARLAHVLVERFSVLFACLDESGAIGEQLRKEGFEVHVLGRRPGLDWRCVRRLAALLRRERVDLLHAHQYTPFFYGATARMLGRRCPILMTEHGRPFPDHPRPKRMLANRLLLGRRDRLVGVGRAVRRALIDNEGFPASRVGVLYNGIDTDPLDPCLHDRDAARAELGLGAGDLAIVQVARLDALKDHATAIRTIERVASRRPSARLILVGEGPERPVILAMVAGRGLGPHVILLGTRSDVPRLLAAADVVLLTSVSEGIPLTLIEAMAAGRPIVSTDVGGVREVVEDGRTALLAPARDDAALADRIERLASDRALRERLGRAGPERAAEFSERRMHAEYLALYGAMIGAGPPRPSRVTREELLATGL